ncbi:MAG: SGNH/GDSL hydrolase family protein [Peptococcaceae bacterium]|nr:SGNH/GDSL hydrolase family protein [Peptococcaceae bacterium]
MNAKNFFKINKRVFIFILAGLAALDWTVGLFISKRFDHPEGQRLPSYDEATVGLWIEQVEKSSGYKVVMLGDSVIHGNAVESSCETLPAHVARELQESLPGREIRVFNLGMAGAAPAEVYFLISALAGAGVDLFIYNINLGWFARESVLDHRSLLKLKGGPSGPGLQGPGSGPEEKPATPVEEWLAGHVFSRWKLYRYRVLLNCWLFGKPLREKLAAAQEDPRLLLPFAEDRLPGVLEMRAPWRQKNWDGKLDPAGGRLGSLSLDSSNRQWLFYRLMIEQIGQRKLSAVFFITPRNYELLDRHDMVDRPSYAKNLSAVAEAARSAGITVLDYDSALPADCFSDTVHPLPEGNRILAQKIVRDLIANGMINP